TTGPGSALSFAAPQSFGTGVSPQSVMLTDVTGDGRLDVVVANMQDNTVSVLANQTAPGAGTPAFATQQTFGTGHGPSAVALADLNGDGRPDLAVTNATDQTVSVLLDNRVPLSISNGTATGTIQDDDFPISAAIVAGNNQSAMVNT